MRTSRGEIGTEFSDRGPARRRFTHLGMRLRAGCVRSLQELSETGAVGKLRVSAFQRRSPAGLAKLRCDLPAICVRGILER